MYIPRKWLDSGFGRRFYSDGWQDAVADKPSAYHGTKAAAQLVSDYGQTALQAYKEGYKDGRAAME